MPSVTIGSNTYPSLASVDQADAYLAGDVARAARWAVLQAEAKARGLISATRLLLRQSWCGDTPDPSGVVPEVVSDVAAILAVDLLTKPRLQSNPSGGSNVKVAKAGSAQVEFFGPTTGTANPLPDEAWAMLLAAGLVGCVVTIEPTANDGPFVSGTSRGGCGPCGDWSALCDDDDRRAGGWC